MLRSQDEVYLSPYFGITVLWTQTLAKDSNIKGIDDGHKNTWRKLYHLTWKFFAPLVWDHKTEAIISGTGCATARSHEFLVCRSPHNHWSNKATDLKAVPCVGWHLFLLHLPFSKRCTGWVIAPLSACDRWERSHYCGWFCWPRTSGYGIISRKYVRTSLRVCHILLGISCVLLTSKKIYQVKKELISNSLA